MGDGMVGARTWTYLLYRGINVDRRGLKNRLLDHLGVPVVRGR